MQQVSDALLFGLTDEHIHWLSPNTGIHKAAVKPFNAMQAAAKRDGINITIASGYRSFERQLSIWNRKVSGELAIKDNNNATLSVAALSDSELISAILHFSALPGASRHHWGTDIDVYADNLLAPEQSLELAPWEYQTEGPFYPLKLWLDEHAHQFDFYFPYQTYQGGVAQEPWHLSYYPLAEQYLTSFNQDTLAEHLKEIDLAKKQYVLTHLADIIERYTYNINSPKKAQ